MGTPRCLNSYINPYKSIYIPTLVLFIISVLKYVAVADSFEAKI